MTARVARLVTAAKRAFAAARPERALAVLAVVGALAVLAALAPVVGSLRLPASGAAAVPAGVPAGAPGPASPGRSFQPRFGTSGLVTNEYASRRPDGQDAQHSHDWTVTSGSLFARDGAGWTGFPDTVGPDAHSSRGTNSAVFRLVSRRRDFRDVRVSFQLRIDGQLPGPHSYDGVHVWLRYVDQHELYAVSVARRDGLVTIKRKSRGGGDSEGAYKTLATAKTPVNRGAWIPIAVQAYDTGGGVELSVAVAGRKVLTARDTAGGQASLGAGGVGIRGDNTEFEFKNFRADPL